jgi:hypothetical protein
MCRRLIVLGHYGIDNTRILDQIPRVDSRGHVRGRIVTSRVVVRETAANRHLPTEAPAGSREVVPNVLNNKGGGKSLFYYSLLLKITKDRLHRLNESDSIVDGMLKSILVN